MNRPNDFARTCTHLMHANERARNALDGLTAENWMNLEMGYAISEALIAVLELTVAIHEMNAEENGRHEGQTTTLLEREVKGGE